MAKRISSLPPELRIIDNPGKEDSDDTHIDGEYRSVKSGKSYKNYQEYFQSGLSLSLDMSPQVLYTVHDAAEILEKASVTIRKEARNKEIGTIKGQGYLFTDGDILSLINSFKEKEERNRHPLDKPSGEISVARVLFERVAVLHQTILEYRRERDRFLVMFQEIFDQYRGFVEETEKRLNKLERGK